jgi:hypothetical protein
LEIGNHLLEGKFENLKKPLLVCHKEVIDNLRHDIPDSRHKLESIFNGHQREPLDKLAKHALQERMDMFRRVYEEVREEFHQFEAEWM